MLEEGSADTIRDRIITATAMLIREGGRDAATTRAVAAAADVQAPTIYRLFGNKQALLDAVAESGYAAYVAGKAVEEHHADALEDFRYGWDTHIAFGLAHPELFAIISTDPRPRPALPSYAAGLDALRARVRRLAVAGRLRVSEDRAIGLIQAAANGTILTLLQQPEQRRDTGLSYAAREAVIAAITTATPQHDEHASSAAAAVTLRASLEHIAVLSAGERLLLSEMLDRITNTA